VDRLFLDANVLFSAAYRDDAGVRRLWTAPNSELVTSEYAIEEATRNLADSDQKERLDGLLESVEVVPAGVLDPDVRGDVKLRDKDWPILSGAVAAGATHLITGDIRDFGVYFGQKVLGVLILPPSQYLQARSQQTLPKPPSPGAT